MKQTPQESLAQRNRKPKLRWYQFSLWRLGIVVTAMCVGLAWLIHDVREQEAVALMIDELDGGIEFGEPNFFGRIGVVRSLFGEYAFAPILKVRLGGRTTNAHLLQLKRLRNIQRIELAGTQVTDLSPLARLSGLTKLDVRSTRVRDVSPLARLRGLTKLYLGGTQVSDLSPLAGLTGLTELGLDHTPVTKLSPLAGTTRLEILNLSETPVTDLSPLAGLSALTHLGLNGTHVTDLSPLAGLTNLQLISIDKDQEVLVPESLKKVIVRH